MREGVVRVHVFVDESDRSAYLVCAARVYPAETAAMRRLVQSFRLPGQHRLHFVKERPSRRREILDALARTNVRVRLYSCRAQVKLARQRCLRQLVTDLEEPRAERLIIEPVDGLQTLDRETIYETSRGNPNLANLTYHHLSAHNEPLLWIPDAVAWAYGAGAPWQRRIENMIDKVIHLDDERESEQRETRPPTVRRRTGSTFRG